MTEDTTKTDSIEKQKSALNACAQQFMRTVVSRFFPDIANILNNPPQLEPGEADRKIDIAYGIEVDSDRYIVLCHDSWGTMGAFAFLGIVNVPDDLWKRLQENLANAGDKGSNNMLLADIVLQMRHLDGSNVGIRWIKNNYSQPEYVNNNSFDQQIELIDKASKYISQDINRVGICQYGTSINLR